MFRRKLPLAWLDARVQRTSCLAQVQRSVGMALGGEVGKRLLTLLHEGTSGDTLLRLIRQGHRKVDEAIIFRDYSAGGLVNRVLIR